MKLPIQFRSSRSAEWLLLLLVATAVGASAAPVDPPLEAFDGCPAWRWVGITPEGAGSCPVPDSRPGFDPWTVRRLFDPGGGGQIPPGLQAFCLYENPGVADAAAVRDLLLGGALTDLGSDCMAIAPLGELEDQTWSPLAGHFLLQAGQSPLPVTAGPPTRLALLDSGATREADAERFPGNSPHGWTLANMAADLLCDGGTCRADVTSQLALPWLSFDRKSRSASQLNEVDGGFVGTLGDLAQALRREVRAWLAEPPPGRRLVINLSLGWDRLFGGLTGPVADMPAPVQAIYRAIEDAVCRGALVVAAAGNGFGGPEPNRGPLLPAAWELRPAPTGAACVAALEVLPDPADFPPPGQPVYRPLVHAAGAARADGTALSNSRFRGLPRLMAFSDHGVVESHLTDQPTATLTGSSVAAAVVSAAAAAAWSYRSDLRADEIMQTLYDGGVDLGVEADFCLDGRRADLCPPQGGQTVQRKRVAVCDTVVELCASGGGDCPDPSELPVCPAWPPAPPDLTEVDLPFAEVVDAGDLAATLLDPVCQGESLAYDPAFVPADPCPHHQYWDLARESWLGPQPGSNPCPNCGLDPGAAGPAESRPQGGGAVLLLEIADDFEGVLTDATLKADDVTYNLSGVMGSLKAGDQLKVIGLPVTGEEKIFLSVTLDGERSAVAPLVVK